VNGDVRNASAAVPEEEANATQRHAHDLAFVRKLLANDPAALDTLPRRLACLPAMIRHQNRELGGHLNETDIEDAVRDTIAALWAKLPAFEGRSTLETWVYRFAFLEVLKAIQRKCRSPRPLEADHSERLRSSEDAEQEVPRFEARDLAEGMSCLTRTAAEVIRLRHFDEQSFEAIAARLGTGVNTVKARYYRGLARLKAVLERKQRREGA
jgi:RNA polymerase sigma-70 factor (ECF subfamily)